MTGSPERQQPCYRAKAGEWRLVAGGVPWYPFADSQPA